MSCQYLYISGTFLVFVFIGWASSHRYYYDDLDFLCLFIVMLGPSILQTVKVA